MSSLFAPNRGQSVIYGLVDCLGTIRYVGNTTLSLRRRLSLHHSRGRKWAAGIVVLDTVDESVSKEAEQRQIDRWGEWGDLENRRVGRRTPSAETRVKQSESMKLAGQTEAQRNGLAKAQRAKIGVPSPLRGRSVPAEVGRKISAAKKGKPQPWAIANLPQYRKKEGQ